MVGAEQIGCASAQLDAAVRRGQPVVMLDAGPRDLGQAGHPGEPGPLDGAPRLKPGEGYVESRICLPAYEALNFAQLAEPESHVQPGQNGLFALVWSAAGCDVAVGWFAWRADYRQPKWMWRAGPRGFSRWSGRSAAPTPVPCSTCRSYFAYELAGYYGFSNKPKDARSHQSAARAREFSGGGRTGPEGTMNPDAKVVETDLAQQFSTHANGEAQRLSC